MKDGPCEGRELGRWRENAELGQKNGGKKMKNRKTGEFCHKRSQRAQRESHRPCAGSDGASRWVESLTAMLPLPEGEGWGEGDRGARLLRAYPLAQSRTLVLPWPLRVPAQERVWKIRQRFVASGL